MRSARRGGWRAGLAAVACGSIACWVAAARAAGNVDLRLHFARGDVHHVHVTIEQNVEQIVQETHQNTSQTIGMGYTMRVTDVDAEGRATVAVHYDSAVFHAKTPTATVDYDSAKPPAQVPAMAKGLAATVGQQFSMKLSPAGQVMEVEGLDRMVKAILARLDLPPGPQKDASEKAIRQTINEQNLRSNLQNLFPPVPNQPVAPGDSWSRKSRISLGFPLDVETTYALKSVEQPTVTVQVSGKCATPADATLDLGPIKMTYDLKGEQTGTLSVIAATGWTRAAEIDQKLGGTATVGAGNPKVPAQPIAISLTSKMTMESS